MAGGRGHIPCVPGMCQSKKGSVPGVWVQNLRRLWCVCVEGGQGAWSLGEQGTQSPDTSQARVQGPGQFPGRLWNLSRKRGPEPHRENVSSDTEEILGVLATWDPRRERLSPGREAGRGLPSHKFISLNVSEVLFARQG